MRLSSFALVVRNAFHGEAKILCLTWSWTRAATSPPRGSASQPQTKTLLPHKRRDAKQVLDSNSLFCLYAFAGRTSVQRIDELSFHHAFIGPIDLNAQFLELAVKRGPREMQDLSAFFYIAGGAFEGLHDRFTLNLRHRH